MPSAGSTAWFEKPKQWNLHETKYTPCAPCQTSSPLASVRKLPSVRRSSRLIASPLASRYLRQAP